MRLIDINCFGAIGRESARGTRRVRCEKLYINLDFSSLGSAKWKKNEKRERERKGNKNEKKIQLKSHHDACTYRSRADLIGPQQK
jgi:hypothetical protein